MPVQEDEGLLDEPDSPIVHGSPPWQLTGTLESTPGGVLQPKRVLFRASQPLRRAWVCCGLCGCMLLAALLLLSLSVTDRRPTHLPASPPAVPFVTASGGRLYRGEHVRRFMGANLWYAVHLGCRGCDRARLRRELDALRAAGVSSVRITALSEGPDDAPWRVVPTLQPSPGRFAAHHAEGLDYTLQQLELRGMDATVTLHNMWPWSGGFAQYVSWSSGEPIPYPPPAKGGDWATFQAFAARFYEDEAAMAMADAAVAYVVGRVSSLTGAPLATSRAILGWELCNEPRGDRRHAAYLLWLRRAARLVKRLDPNHLLLIGSEGATPFKDAGVDVLQDHALHEIDAVTIHVWPQNWGWYELGSRTPPHPRPHPSPSLALALTFPNPNPNQVRAHARRGEHRVAACGGRQGHRLRARARADGGGARQAAHT
jgi:hypothetical protein